MSARRPSIAAARADAGSARRDGDEGRVARRLRDERRAGDEGAPPAELRGEGARAARATRAVYVGTASWAVPREHLALTAAPPSATGLQRYATALSAVEINSTFYRRHRASTFARWASSVPETFRFSVKMPKAITHEAALSGCRRELTDFFDDVRPLGPKLGPVLVQLAPSHAFHLPTARRFFDAVRDLHGGEVVLEPRHRSWFEEPAVRVLAAARVPYVVADPSRSSLDALDRVADTERAPLYVRLHGAPRTYWSAYGPKRLRDLAARVARSPSAGPLWIVFDNTAAGAAFREACALRAHVGARDDGHPRAAPP